MVNLLPDAALAPPGEAFVDGIVFAEALGQVLPGDSGACNPEDGIDKEAVIGGISAWFARLSWQQGREAFEVVVGDSVAVHELGVRFKSPRNARSRTKVPAHMNFSFVHTT